MSERIRATKYLFFADLMADVMKNIRQNVTVTAFSYDRMHDHGVVLEFEVRVTKVGELLTPPIRRPTTRKDFQDRMVRFNTPRILRARRQQKGKQR
jgi:fructose/tagatose bisphosphate aldolase